MRRIAGRSPKIHVGEVIAQAVQLDAFHEKEVFPQRAGIMSSPCRHRAEVADDGVSNAVVAEVHFFAFFELIAQISGKGRTNFDNEALLKEPDVIGDRGFIEAGFSGQAVIVHFRADTVGKKLDQMHQTIVLTDARKSKQILVQNSVAIIPKRELRKIGGREDGGIGAIDHQSVDVLTHLTPASVGGNFRD